MSVQTIEAIGAFVPLLQSLCWIILAVFLALYFRPHVADLASALHDRVKAGAEVETPWITLRGAPEEVRGDSPAVATSEGAGGGPVPDDIRERLSRQDYPPGIVDNIYLIHAAETVRPRRPSKAGLWRVRVWTEAYTVGALSKIRRVSYRLYQDEFPRPVISTEDRDSDFELWLTVYGEFTVIAYVELDDGTGVWLTRYLDLPGRPPE